MIDFGQLAVGDPACDLAVYWTFFEGESKSVFREMLRLDTATWGRARAWVLGETLCDPLPGSDVKRILANILFDT